MDITELKASVQLTTDSGQVLNFGLTAPRKKLGTVSECAEALMDAFLAAFEKICGIKYDGGETVKKHEATIARLEKQVRELGAPALPPVPAYTDPEDVVVNAHRKAAKAHKKPE